MYDIDSSKTAAWLSTRPSCFFSPDIFGLAGAIYFENSITGTLNLYNSTITDNYASRYGGGLRAAGTETVRNCIIWGNDSPWPTISSWLKQWILSFNILKRIFHYLP